MPHPPKIRPVRPQIPRLNKIHLELQFTPMDLKSTLFVFPGALHFLKPALPGLQSAHLFSPLSLRFQIRLVRS